MEPSAANAIPRRGRFRRTPCRKRSNRMVETYARTVYGVIPSRLNNWETGLVRKMDQDNDATIRWWHRNLPHKPWAVNVLLPDGRGFFPDFLVGVDGRKSPDGILLAEPKFQFERREEAPKVEARHAAYGKVLVLHLDRCQDWRVVRLDEKSRRPVLAESLRIADLAGWG